MKILIGRSKNMLIKKIKIVSSKVNYLFSKYHFLKYYRIISFINDRRQEIEYNSTILVIISPHQNNKILKIIKRNDSY